MFDDDEIEALPYVKGSETSQETAELAAKHAKKLARAIFTLIVEAGDQGMTTDELNQHFGPLKHENQGVSPRVLDLADRNMITRGPDKRRTRANKPAKVSRAVPAAIVDFDGHWHRRVKKSPEQRALEHAVQALLQLTKQIAKQARARSAELPTLAEAQRLVADALLGVYRALMK